MRLEFIKSAVLPEDYPKANRPEIVISGRSNSGKSSFINAVANSKKVALVSGKPGKTRTINFFKSDQSFNFVDLPGYGYASRGAKERDSWGQMIETYFSARTQITGVLLLMDIRRNWQDEEQNFAEFLNSRGIPLAVLLTKADKMSRMQQLKFVDKMRKTLDSDFVFAISSLKKTGIKEVLNFCNEGWKP